MKRRFRAVGAWLCLGVIAFTGVAPAQGLVLCLEPDGAVALEIGSAEVGCGGCPLSSTEGEAARAEETDHEDCPCVDIPIFGPVYVKPIPPTTVELRLDGATVPVPLLCPAPTLELPEVREVRREPPRPPPSLLLLRTVVLLV